MTTPNPTASQQIYPINPPKEVPGYVVESVQSQCNSALTHGLENPSATIRHIKDQKIQTELWALRECIAGNKSSNDPWVSWGYHTVSQAWQDAERLALFREALGRDDISHVTNGHSVSRDAYHIYRRDMSSPSGCILVTSISKNLPGVSIVMKGHLTCAGGERGEMAARAMMRG